MGGDVERRCTHHGCLDGHSTWCLEQDDVGYDLPGKLWTFPMRAGQRLVLATSTMLRLTSHGRMLSALSHLRRAERAATTLVTQQGQMAAQASSWWTFSRPSRPNSLSRRLLFFSLISKNLTGGHGHRIRRPDRRLGKLPLAPHRLRSLVSCTDVEDKPIGLRNL